MESPLHPRYDRTLLVIAGVFVLAALSIIVAAMVMLKSPTQVADEEALPSTDENRNTDPMLYVTTMTHMEGKFMDDRDEDLFLRHVDDLRWAMNLFDEYDAKLTVETEQSFAKANTVWDLNLLAEIIDRGHGVGTHADFGAEERPKPLPYYIEQMKANKGLVDDLVGAENNRGLSGGIGAYDWVTAADRAGFSYMDGIVGFAYLSMDESNRPDGWSDAYIRANAYHDPAPVAFEDRIQFMPLNNADDFVADDTAAIVIASGEIGEFASLSEGRQNCRGTCTLTTSDADVFLDAVRDAEEVRQRLRVPVKVNMHIPASLYNEANEEVFRYLLHGLADLAQEFPSLVFATQGEAYDGYAAWASAR